MSAVAVRPSAPKRPAPDTAVWPIGRLGRYTATHFRVVLASWIVIALVLGFFAPRVEKALSGAGWKTTGSQSVQARQLIDRNSAGLSSYGLMTVVYAPTKTVNDPVIAGVERTLRADGAVKTVVAPKPGISISPDGHTAIVQASAARNSNQMVAAADTLNAKLAGLSASGTHARRARGDRPPQARPPPHRQPPAAFLRRQRRSLPRAASPTRKRSNASAS